MSGTVLNLNVERIKRSQPIESQPSHAPAVQKHYPALDDLTVRKVATEVAASRPITEKDRDHLFVLYRRYHADIKELTNALKELGCPSSFLDEAMRDAHVARTHILSLALKK